MLKEERIQMFNYKEYKKVLQERTSQLEEIIRAKTDALQNAPEGYLRAAKHRNKIQYFVKRSPKDGNGSYIKKDNIDLAIRLAQKEYDEKVLMAAQEEIKILKRMNRLYDNMVVETVPEKITKTKLMLVEKVKKTDEEYIREWLSQDYEHVTNFPENLKLTNSKGIKMRSKSEVLISSILDEYNIPYLYEKPLRIGKYKMVLPDFTLLDIRNRQEVHLEHLGMLDDVEYLAKNLDKIKTYEENGFYLGRQLIVTYETREKPIDTRVVRGMIKEYFEL